jgi:hypothetical protein
MNDKETKVIPATQCSTQARPLAGKVCGRDHGVYIFASFFLSFPLPDILSMASQRTVCGPDGAGRGNMGPAGPLQAEALVAGALAHGQGAAGDGRLAHGRVVGAVLVHHVVMVLVVQLACRVAPAAPAAESAARLGGAH